MVRRVLTLPSLTLVGSLLLGTGLPAESEQSVLPLEVAARTAARKDAARTLIPLLRHVRQRATAATEVRPGSTPNSPFTGTQTSLFVFTVGKRSVPVDPAAVEAMDRLLRWKVGDPNATDDAALFAAWCEGRTGYPLVDAAMKQLNSTGYMHNRLRMVAASFLVKHLCIDWHWGERYFAAHLNDFDLAANNGGWQWAASTGCDAQPYFRIFNPVTQSEKFDAEGRFIRQYLPVLAKVPSRYIHAPWKMPPLEQQAAGVTVGREYPLPVVDHSEAREAALRMYAAVKAGRN